MNSIASHRGIALLLLSGLTLLCPPGASSAFADGAAANRLTYLDAAEPYYVSHTFPKLTTPMWVGTEGVECAIVHTIDDLADSAKYENFLRPTLNRLKQVAGRSPLSIFVIKADPDDPQLQRWLSEGLSLEVHTLDHPCPIFGIGDLQKLRGTVLDCLDMLAKVPHCRPVALTSPCCDVLNSNSPRLYTEVLEQVTPAGNFLTASSTVHNVFTRSDSELPEEIAIDEAGRDRFLKFVQGNVPILGQAHYQSANYVENYPYPFVVGRLIWEFPCNVPGDHQADFHAQLYGPRVVKESEKSIDATVLKQGLLTFVFHPHGKISPAEMITIIDYAVEKYGKRIEFLNTRDVQERIDRNLLVGHPLRASDGSDNGVRLLDVNNDGFIDVVIGNEKAQRTRLWSPAQKQWQEAAFPVTIVGSVADGSRHEAGVRFGILDADGLPTALVRNNKVAGAWRFDGQTWVEQKARLEGLEIDGAPLFTNRDGIDLGVRLRDIDGDGRCELLVGNASQNAVFAWSDDATRWNLQPYSLPDGTMIVDDSGRDAGLRFADINGDGREDVIFSNETHFSVHEFVSPQAGWARTIIHGEDKPDRAIPPFVREGGNNGAFFQAGRLWVVNETTHDRPNHAFTIALSKIYELASANAR